MQGSLEDLLKTRFNKKELLAKLPEAPSLVKDLASLACADIHPVSWRAAWMLEHHAKHHPAMVEAYSSSLIKVLPAKEDGHQRCIIKLLMELNLDEDQESKLFDTCFNIYEDLSGIPSLRITALDYILKVVKKYPELKAEVLHLFDSRYAQGLSPGILNMWRRKGAALAK